MAKTTGINWCDSTFNPWIGCTRVSPACDHCYAAVSTPARTRGIEWGQGKQRQRTAHDNWKLPERWNRAQFSACKNCGWRGDPHHALVDAGPVLRCPSCEKPTLEKARRRVFCASLSDWLDNEVPIEWLVDLLDLIRRTPNLDYLMLTKRIGNWRGCLQTAFAFAQERGSNSSDYLNLCAWIDSWLSGHAPANVWLGATVVNQAEADRDVPKLLQVPARIRFLSVEPMLGAVDLKNIPHPYRHEKADWVRLAVFNYGTPYPASDGIHWVICGGESGPKARPLHPDWVRSLRDQCAAAGVPFMFKQWGAWFPYEAINPSGVPIPGDAVLIPGADPYILYERQGKKRAGNTLDGRQHLEWPA